MINSKTKINFSDNLILSAKLSRNGNPWIKHKNLSSLMRKWILFCSMCNLLLPQIRETLAKAIRRPQLTRWWNKVLSSTWKTSKLRNLIFLLTLQWKNPKRSIKSLKLSMFLSWNFTSRNWEKSIKNGQLIRLALLSDFFGRRKRTWVNLSHQGQDP